MGVAAGCTQATSTQLQLEEPLALTVLAAVDPATEEAWQIPRRTVVITYNPCATQAARDGGAGVCRRSLSRIGAVRCIDERGSLSIAEVGLGA